VRIFTLVDDVQRIVEQFRRQRGEFTLAMLYNTGGLQADSSWNFIVSAPWTDEMGFAEATRFIAESLSRDLEFQDKHAISRVTVLKTTDPFVRDMTRLYPDIGAAGPMPINQLTAGSVNEGSGFVLYSQKLAA
jgi:hypothetical protein